MSTEYLPIRAPTQKEIADKYKRTGFITSTVIYEGPGNKGLRYEATLFEHGEPKRELLFHKHNPNIILYDESLSPEWCLRHGPFIRRNALGNLEVVANFRLGVPHGRVNLYKAIDIRMERWTV